MSRWISRNRAVARHPLVGETARLAGAEIVTGGRGRSLLPDPGPDLLIGWGYKASGFWAREQARIHSVKFRLFEDGFIRSLKPGYGSGALYSLVQDGAGIYYDGSGQSDLVALLNDGPLDGDHWQEDAGTDLLRYRETGASKYNWFAGEFDGEVLDRAMPEPGVLVVDQTAGDASIRHGGMAVSGFEKMLEAALEDNPGQPVYLRGHPDHLFRSKRSCLRGSRLLNDPRVRSIPACLAPWQVFERTGRVYVGTSMMGAEALVHGKPVVTFGCPFYAGWGLTDDRNPSLPMRTRRRSLLELFHAAFRCYSRYFDPDTLEPCSMARILDHLALQKERFRENAGEWIGLGMSPWKRPLMARYLASPGARIRQTRSARIARRWCHGDREGRLLLWGRGEQDPFIPAAETFRVEDGFLRSAGLGAEFHTPLSLIFDRSGIYFDSTVSSDLESVLREHDFTGEEIRQAEELAELILRKSLTKYNLEGKTGVPASWPEAGGGTRILVPGQVECDASVRWGSPRWRSNLELLREVRRRNEEAVIAYKPHPDVVKHLRPGRPLSREIEEVCDVVVADLDIVPWLESCDELHTLTSLSGFEALLRRKKVVCYGSPFYAGWGLTEDLIPSPRRGRQRSLAELVAASLILYPRYLNPVTGEFTTAVGAAGLIARRDAPVFSRPWYFRAVAWGKTLLRRGLDPV